MVATSAKKDQMLQTRHSCQQLLACCGQNIAASRCWHVAHKAPACASAGMLQACAQRVLGLTGC